MGNCVNRFIVRTITNNSVTTGTAISNIKAETFSSKYEESLRVRKGCLDRLVRYILTPKKCPIPAYREYMTGVNSDDLHFTFSYLATSVYGWLLNTLHINTYWESTTFMLNTLPKWGITINTSCEKEFISFAGLEEFYSRHCDLIDILTREGQYFVIDTLYLNDYEYKPGLSKLGCKAYFTLQEDGFHFVSLTYNEVTYDFDDDSLQLKIALRALYGGTSLIRTFLSHATGIHYLASARITKATQEHLKGRLLEQILKPFMFKTVNGLARATRTLFANGEFFHTFGPFTYKGLCSLIKNYIQQHSSLETELSLMNGVEKYWQLDSKEAETLPFKSLNTWIKYIRTHVNEYVNASLEKEPLSTFGWLNQILGYTGSNQEDTTKRLITYAYFLQIRHTYMADPLLDNIFFRYSYNLPTIVTAESYQDSYNTKWEHFMKIAVDLSTSFSWIKMETNLSSIITDTQCRDIWNRFYTGLPHLTIDSRLSLIQVNNINASTGL